MDWIKRNLYFVIGSLAALVLMGLAGYYLYSKWQLNNEVLGHRIENLVVFAAPRTLGEVRKHYHKQTERVVLKEYHKDMVGKPPAEIVAALREQH